MQVKRKMSGGKSAHSFYPAPGIYHLRSKELFKIINDTSLLTDEYYYKPQTVTRHNYGIGSISFSTAFGRTDAKDVLCAFEFLAFREATGIPYRLSYVVNKNEFADGTGFAKCRSV